MLRIPRLAVTGLTWTGSIPQQPWRPSFQLQGGGDVSAAGVPAAWVDRDDRLLELHLRFYESEWPALRAVLRYAQANGAVLTFTPDVDAPGVTYATYLHAPEVGKEVRPDRGTFPGEMALSITVRSTDGSALEPAYF